MGWDAGTVLALNRFVVDHGLGWLTHLLGVELTYVYPIAILTLWFTRDAARRRRAFSTGLAVVIAAGLYYTTAHLVLRHRPDVSVPGVTGLISRIGAIDDPSFPSGHATAGFAVAVGLGIGEPALLGTLALVALLNALGRIAAGVHYPTDVLAGAALGSAVALAFHAIRPRLNRIEAFFRSISDRLLPFLPHPPTPDRDR